MRLAVVFFGTQTAAHTEYFKKYGITVLQAASPQDPFTVHSTFQGYDFLLCWNAPVVPKRGARDLRGDLDLTKINVTWDSYGRNYPHKTAQRYSRDLIGFPAGLCPRSANLEDCKLEDLCILPKDVNVSVGYREYDAAQFQNGGTKPPFVKTFHAESGRWI
jgi:hypothetical protein